MKLTAKLDKDLQQKLIAFVVIVFFGLIFWQLTSHVFVPPKREIDQDIQPLVAVMLSAELRTEIMPKINEARSFEIEELQNFDIYLDDSETSRKENGFFVKKMFVKEPFDLGFYSIDSASVSGIIKLEN